MNIKKKKKDGWECNQGMLEKVLNKTVEGIWLSYRRGRLKMVNRTWVSLVGCEADKKLKISFIIYTEKYIIRRLVLLRRINLICFKSSVIKKPRQKKKKRNEKIKKKKNQFIIHQ